MNETALPVPEPSPNPETEFFWRKAAQGVFVLPICVSCGEVIWYPRTLCPFCHATNVIWKEASGTGTIYSFTTVRRGTGPYASCVPYVLAYVELAEGPRVLTNITGAEPSALSIGQPVTVAFDRSGDGYALPRFRPL